MTAHASECQEVQHWESAHVCPNCNLAINLAENSSLVAANLPETQEYLCPLYRRFHIA